MYSALPQPPNNMSQNIPSNKNIKNVSENKLLPVRQNDVQSIQPSPGNTFKRETNLNNEDVKDEDEVSTISSWVKIEGLPNTLRREDVINQLALLGFMIGKAYATNGITLMDGSRLVKCSEAKNTEGNLNRPMVHTSLIHSVAALAVSDSNPNESRKDQTDEVVAHLSTSGKSNMHKVCLWCEAV